MALGVTQSHGKVSKAVDAMVATPSTKDVAAGTTGYGAPLVGSLTVTATDRASARDQLDEALFALRRIRRGGVYA